MQKQPKPQKIDWGITIFPLAAIVILSLYLVFFPAQAEAAIASLRNLLVNDLGVVYMVFGLGVLLLSFGIAASKYGNIRLGNLEKPRYSTFTWGSMIFTSTMAADILEGKAKPADMAIQTQDAQKPLINLATAKAIGLTIPEDILKNAAVIEK